jgi:hypothetical protein
MSAASVASSPVEKIFDNMEIGSTVTTPGEPVRILEIVPNSIRT